MKKIYLDNAATTQVDTDVLDSMYAVMRDFYGNPSSTHSFGKASKTLVEKARKSIARIFNAQSGEIIFTSGGTEADNLILRAAIRNLGVDVIITSKIEHHAVLKTVEQLCLDNNVTVEYVNLGENGNVDIQHLESLLTKNESQKTLVSLMHVNNEVGNILNIENVANLCKDYKAYFHSDTVQSVHHLGIDTQKIPVDFFTGSAHKFHGPKGIGFAYIRKDSGLRAIVTGGEQERGLRAGTESVHSIVGLETAFLKAIQNKKEIDEHLLKIKQYFKEGLQQAFPDVAFNGTSGDLELSSPSILNVRFPFPPEKGKLLLFHLDLLGGVACSAGSACQSGSNQDSHVLKAILSSEDLKKTSIRFSFSKYNTKEEIDSVLETLIAFAKN
ncbi:cysteine desulfurase [Pustulibacterium marinum]|uniref:cysteine desulfurase n=1 Tax=Pustulibacterium marinum TaxID=1224947 RepID=A0A1I7FBZ0_9FLAO|nr:cysteine desulfurase family protein [Pustulibacterium marinum]SFU33718.1 cysteine desulfurase [Pustulibacterium marinum]